MQYFNSENYILKYTLVKEEGICTYWMPVVYQELLGVLKQFYIKFLKLVSTLFCRRENGDNNSLKLKSWKQELVQIFIYLQNSLKIFKDTSLGC